MRFLSILILPFLKPFHSTPSPVAWHACPLRRNDRIDPDMPALPQICNSDTASNCHTCRSRRLRSSWLDTKANIRTARRACRSPGPRCKDYHNQLLCCIQSNLWLSRRQLRSAPASSVPNLFTLTPASTTFRLPHPIFLRVCQSHSSVRAGPYFKALRLL